MYYIFFHTIIFFIHIHGKRHSKFEKHKFREEYLPDSDIPRVLPETYNRPVNFEHIGKHGFGDTEFKQPLDPLEMRMMMPINPEQALNILKKTENKDVQWIRRDEAPRLFLSPKDEMLHYKINTNNSVRNQKHYDFINLLESNLGINKQNNIGNTVNSKTTKKPNIPRENITGYFDSDKFSLKKMKRLHKPRFHNRNWTTCNEFAKNAVFHPNDIVFTEWVPFYMWSRKVYLTANVHRFVYPTKRIMEYYETSFGPYIQKLDWKQPAVLLVEPREILLLAGDRKGLFYGIIKQEFPSGAIGQNITLSPIIMRMKILDPYLAIMHCDETYAIIMAESGTEPVTDQDKCLEANTLKFRGVGHPISRDTKLERNIADIEMQRKKYAEERKYIDVDRGLST